MDTSTWSVRGSRPKTKLKVALISAFTVAIGGLYLVGTGPVTAKIDSTINEISKYRTWTKMTKNPLAVESFSRDKGFSIDLSGGG